jgi:hypothetical protein
LSDPIRELQALAEEELALIAAGRVAELGELHDRRDAALAALTEPLSAEQRAALGVVHVLHEQVTALLEGALAETSAQLNRLSAGQAALRGYAGALKQA